MHGFHNRLFSVLYIYIYIYTHTHTLYPTRYRTRRFFNPLNAELNPIRHLLALAGAHHFVHVSKIRVNNSNTNEDIATTFEADLPHCVKM
jgi:hypothetical protein